MLFVKSVDNIVAKFDRMISDLEDAIDYHNDKQEDIADKIVELKAEQTKHNKEVTRALVVKSKLQALIN